MVKQKPKIKTVLFQTSNFGDMDEGTIVRIPVIMLSDDGDNPRSPYGYGVAYAPKNKREECGCFLFIEKARKKNGHVITINDEAVYNELKANNDISASDI